MNLFIDSMLLKFLSNIIFHNLPIRLRDFLLYRRFTKAS